MKNKIIAQHAESALRKLKLNDKCVMCLCENCEFKARKLVSMITSVSKKNRSMLLRNIIKGLNSEKFDFWQNIKQHRTPL